MKKIDGIYFDFEINPKSSFPKDNALANRGCKNLNLLASYPSLLIALGEDVALSTMASGQVDVNHVVLLPLESTEWCTKNALSGSFNNTSCANCPSFQAREPNLHNIHIQKGSWKESINNFDKKGDINHSIISYENVKFECRTACSKALKEDAVRFITAHYSRELHTYGLLAESDAHTLRAIVENMFEHVVRENSAVEYETSHVSPGTVRPAVMPTVIKYTDPGVGHKLFATSVVDGELVRSIIRNKNHNQAKERTKHVPLTTSVDVW